MPDVATLPPTPRDRKKRAARDAMSDAVISLMVDARDINHDAVAERAGVGRRTVYRYFPDREALLRGAWSRVTDLAGPQVTMPRTLEELQATLEPIYTGFDKIAPIATVVRSTPQGRALRLSNNAIRVENYSAAVAPAVGALPAEDRRLVTAMLQVLHTTPWLEMRDHWGLTGEQIARVTGWAIRTLLADLERRGSEPI